MIGTYVVAAVALVLFGAAGGYIAVVSLASRRDKDMTTPTSSRVARGARVANGLHIRRLDPLHEASAYRHDLPRLIDREW
jgi:hypothetical protein